MAERGPVALGQRGVRRADVREHVRALVALLARVPAHVLEAHLRLGVSVRGGVEGEERGGTFWPSSARWSSSAERYWMSSLFLTGSPFAFRQFLACQPGSHSWKPGNRGVSVVAGGHAVPGDESAYT